MEMLPLVTDLPEGHVSVSVRKWSALLCLLALAGAATAYLCIQFGFAYQCMLLKLTGIPCPFCGGTRALSALAIGDFTAALRWNPLATFGFVSVLVSALVSLIRGRHLRFSQSRIQWIVLGIIISLNWLYLIFFLPR
jgi:hypothetical protein